MSEVIKNCKTCAHSYNSLLDGGTFTYAKCLKFGLYTETARQYGACSLEKDWQERPVEEKEVKGFSLVCCLVGHKWQISKFQYPHSNILTDCKYCLRCGSNNPNYASSPTQS